MTTEQILIGIIGLFCAALGWFANQLYQSVQKLHQADSEQTEALAKLETRIGTDFVRYDRLQDMLRPIKDGIDEIKAAMARKADKP